MFFTQKPLLFVRFRYFIVFFDKICLKKADGALFRVSFSPLDKGFDKLSNQRGIFVGNLDNVLTVTREVHNHQLVFFSRCLQLARDVYVAKWGSGVTQQGILFHTEYLGKSFQLGSGQIGFAVFDLID